MDKTLKIRAYSEDANNPAPQNQPADEKSLELAMKDAQIEEERGRSLEHLKTIVQLRESLKQEQARSAEITRKAAELEARVQGAGAQEANELAKRNVQLEEEKKKTLEQTRMIEQLRESLHQEQAKTAEMVKMMTEQEARTKSSAALEAKVREMADALGKIAVIAAAGKTA